MLDPNINIDGMKQSKYFKKDVTRGEFMYLTSLVNNIDKHIKEKSEVKTVNTFPTEQEALKATMPLIPSGNMKIEQMILGATIMYNYLKKKLGE